MAHPRQAQTAAGWWGWEGQQAHFSG